MRRLVVFGYILLLLTGCSLSFNEDDESTNQDVTFTDEDIIEKFGIGTENFNAMTHGNIELEKDDGKGFLEYAVNYEELDLNVESRDFEFGHDLYYILSQDLELLTYLALDDIGQRNDEHNGVTEEDKTREDFDFDNYEYLYTGVIYKIQDIGTIELELESMIGFVYHSGGTIEFSWFEDVMKWDSEKIQQKYEGFKKRNQ